MARKIECQECGDEWAVPETARETVCPFCGAAFAITPRTPSKRLIAAATEARDLLAARVTVAGRSMTVAELIAAHEREQWQPIETAPNGESILVFYEDGTIDFVEPDENHFTWYPYKGPIAGAIQTTHWRPLPPAPTDPEPRT